MSKRREKSGRRPQGGKSRNRAQKKRDQGSGQGRKVSRGKVQKNPKGFAFIVPLHAEFEDTFVSREEAAALLHGDTVDFMMVRRGPKTSAHIVKIVDRRSNRIIGKI